MVSARHLLSQIIAIFTIFFLLLLISCSKEEEPSLAKKIASTKQGLNEMIVRCRKNQSPFRTEYLIPAYNSALKALDSNIPLYHPVLFSAHFFSKIYRKGYSPKCLFMLNWLEDDFKVKGVFIIDEVGTRWEFNNLFDWTSEDKDDFYYSVWRCRTIGVNVKGVREWSSNPPCILSKDPLPFINLPPDVFRGKIMVGLITQDGVHTDMISAYISPSFLADPCMPYY